MLYEKDRGLEGQKQLLDLHSGNYIDVISRMQIEELLLTFQPTILFVEHDKTFCDRIATKVVQL